MGHEDKNIEDQFSEDKLKELEEKFEEADKEVNKCWTDLYGHDEINDENEEASEEAEALEVEQLTKEINLKYAIEKRDEFKKRIYEEKKKKISAERCDGHKKEADLFRKGKLVSETLEDYNNPDIFDRKRVAKNVAEELCDPLTQSPHNIAVLAEWGTGKTTFFKYIQDEIKEKNKKDNSKKNRYKVVNFNAAEYSSKVISTNSSEHVEQQWCNLLKALFAEFEKEHPIKAGISYNFWRFWELKSIGKCLLHLIVIVINIVIIFLFNLLLDSDIIKNLDVIKNLDFKSLNIIEGISLGLVTFVPIVSKSLNTAIPISNKIGAFANLPSYSDIFGRRDKIRTDFKVLLKAWLKEKNGEKIIIFVDDCDRCSEDGIMELFEALHLFLDFKNVIFVFAIDEKVLNRAIFKYYGDSESQALADQFLQKYISDTIVLNKPNYGKLIGSLKEIIEPSMDEQKKYPGVHCLSEDEYEKFIRYLPFQMTPTPRCVKQLLNNVVRLKNLYMNDYDLAKAASFETIIAWYMFNYFYTADCEKLKTKSFSKNYLKFNELSDDTIDEKVKNTYIWRDLQDTYVGEIITIDSILTMMLAKTSITKPELFTEVR
ncbi:KAP family P-loop domain-containing protein [Lachnospiraceae bacterium C10]|nr:KAP family P-loop domain-containing protein [Lachnospiraceae bacterium C10]